MVIEEICFEGIFVRKIVRWSEFIYTYRRIIISDKMYVRYKGAND